MNSKKAGIRKIPVIILTGGKGERLNPITVTKPKSMVFVAGRPVLGHIIDHFKYFGFRDFFISVIHKKERIIRYLSRNKKKDINVNLLYGRNDYSQGTAGVILDARKFISGTFIVCYGDILRDLDIQKMLDLHKKSSNIATICIYSDKGKTLRSLLEIDQNGKLTKFLENPQLKADKKKFWSNASFYIFEPEIFDHIKADSFQDFSKDVFPVLLKKGILVQVFKSQGYLIDIGTHRGLKKARRDAKKGKFKPYGNS